MESIILCIDLGGTAAKLAFIRTNGILLEKWMIDVKNEESNQIVPNIIHSIKEKMKQIDLSNEDIFGIGMGVPGAVDRKQGTVTGAFNLGWTTTQNIQKEFNHSFPDVPFYLENDANVACLGEKWQGSGNDLENIIFITLGTGVGGGIVLNNQLIIGKDGCAGEIGHLHITNNKIYQCTCGNQGCLESVASATGMSTLTKYLSETNRYESDLLKLNIEEITPKIVFDCAKENDVFALAIVEEFSKYIAIACSHLMNILNPDKIIIGGGISSAGNFLLEKIVDKLDVYTFPKIEKENTVVLANLGNDAGIYGAAKLVIMKQER